MLTWICLNLSCSPFGVRSKAAVTEVKPSGLCGVMRRRPQPSSHQHLEATETSDLQHVLHLVLRRPSFDCSSFNDLVLPRPLAAGESAPPAVDQVEETRLHPSFICTTLWMLKLALNDINKPLI